MNIVCTVAMLFGAYLVGAIPVGYYVTKKITGRDIRLIGSGKTGATNVEREAGQNPAKITLILDALKGYSISVIAFLNFGLLSWIVAVSLLLVVVGHRFSIFLYLASAPEYKNQEQVPALTKIRRVFSRLKGGSGVASFLGFIVPILASANFDYPWTVLGTIGLIAGWLVVKKKKRIMSLASLFLLSLIILYFGLLGFFTHFAFCPYLIIFTAGTALFVIVNHWENIQRLLKGTETTTDFL